MHSNLLPLSSPPKGAPRPSNSSASMPASSLLPGSRDSGWPLPVILLVPVETLAAFRYRIRTMSQLTAPRIASTGANASALVGVGTYGHGKGP